MSWRQLKLVPDTQRLAGIAADHKDAIQGRMFFIERQPDTFDQIIGRISEAQETINRATSLVKWIRNNVRRVYSGAWMQAVVVFEGKEVRSEMVLKNDSERAITSVMNKIVGI